MSGPANVTDAEREAVCLVARDTSSRGRGVSLRDALQSANYRRCRPGLTPVNLTQHLSGRPDLIDDWLRYSEDKRTSGGWYIRAIGREWEIGRVALDSAIRRFSSAPEACAHYVLAELDFCAQVGNEATA